MYNIRMKRLLRRVGIREMSVQYRFSKIAVLLVTASLLPVLAFAEDEAVELPTTPEWAKEVVSKEQLAAAAEYGIPVAFENSIGMRFVLIPAGEFMMGSKHSPEEIRSRWSDDTEWYKKELPRHKVKLTKPFYLSIYETTRGEFGRFVREKGYKTDVEKTDAFTEEGGASTRNLLAMPWIRADG